MSKDPSTYPISICGVDVFAKRKETLKFNEKLAKLKTICEREQLKDSEKGITDIVREMMQSDDLPLLVNWKEKFASMEDLLSSIRNKTVRDEKRLLFNLAEASTYVTDYMTDQQIESDLMYYIHPLIGEYICKVEEGQSKDSTNSKVILESLMRLLKKCLEKLHKTDKVDASLLRYSQYNCFINYLKDILELHKNSVTEKPGQGTELRASQVCAFVKVIYDCISEDRKVFFYFIENSYPALVTDLMRLVHHVVLKEIPKSDREKEKYHEMIEGCVYLIYAFYSYVVNSYNHQEGSAVPNPYTGFVINLYKPFLYSSSDFIKKASAMKIKSLITYNLAYQVHQRKKDKNTGASKPEKAEEEQSKMFSKQLFSISVKTIIDLAKKDAYLLEPQKQDVEMEAEDSDNELKKAIEMSLEEKKSPELKQDVVMSKEGAPNVVTHVDMSLDLIEYFKDEIIDHAKKEDILNADLIIYLMTKCIKIYGKFRSGLANDTYDQRINDCLIEIIDKTITSNSHATLLGKSKSCETTYVLIETINSLVSFYDKQPINLVSRNKRDKKPSPSKGGDKASSKDVPKARMRTQIIFNLLERLKEKQNGEEPAIITWLAKMIEQFTEHFINGRGSIIISKTIDKPIV